MASLGKRSNGRFFVRFVDPDGVRRTITLGTSSERQATGIKLKIENLSAARIHDQPVDPETAKWVAGLKDVMRRKLTDVGLIDAPASTDESELALGAFLRRYFEKRKDVKPGTQTNWRHTRRNLLEFFGPERSIDEVTVGDAKDFELYLKTEARDERRKTEEKGLSGDTVRKRISNAKLFFNDAVEHELIDRNPFAKLKSAVKGNRDRDFFITQEMAQAVLDACPDAEWRLIFALSRYGGMRCPSEHLRLKLTDVDWGRDRMRVTSPKTEHHEGQAHRMVPIFPELRPYLEAIWFQPGDGETHFITRYRDTNANLRTQLIKIIRRAGLEPWPKLFQNLRASRQTELEEIFPSHVVNKWIGNSRRVAEKHYLQVTEDHFRKATSGAPGGALHMRSSDAPQTGANEKSDAAKTAKNRGVPQCVARGVGDTGLEPVTSAV